MSWEIFVPPRKSKRPLMDEMKWMFKALAKDPENLAARTDLDNALVYQYAKRLGYKVSVRRSRQDRNFFIVKIVGKLENEG
jgi:hypothetical protein